MQSDRELIDAINAGDADAFERLYHRYRDWVYRLAWRFTANREDALDVLQETFTYLLKKFPGFVLTASMTTFLYPVVKHTALNLRARRSPGQVGDDVLGSLPVPESSQTPRGELAAALGALSPEQREVVLMRFVDGLPLHEISVALDIPLNTVKSRLYNALRTLRDDPRTRDYFLGE
ncbi:MAG: sigma-70 family RNA polymerase sigma factor [Phycisphaerae bacterium]|nr:sigma-70 family RNA polymerase sigma factor [Phycisphaerae bacterium]